MYPAGTVCGMLTPSPELKAYQTKWAGIFHIFYLAPREILFFPCVYHVVHHVSNVSQLFHMLHDMSTLYPIYAYVYVYIYSCSSFYIF